MMTAPALTEALAQRVMGWGVTADRYLTGNREWMPRWRFEPLTRTEDALRLLEAAAPDRYEIRQERPGVYSAAVVIGRRVGEARADTKARAISMAVARAVLGPEVHV
jgi:hypothetical protein